MPQDPEHGHNRPSDKASPEELVMEEAVKIARLEQSRQNLRTVFAQIDAFKELDYSGNPLVRQYSGIISTTPPRYVEVIYDQKIRNFRVYMSNFMPDGGAEPRVEPCPAQARYADGIAGMLVDFDDPIGGEHLSMRLNPGASRPEDRVSVNVLDDQKTIVGKHATYQAWYLQAMMGDEPYHWRYGQYNYGYNNYEPPTE